MASWVCTVCEGLNAGGDACALCEQPRADAPAAAAPPTFDLSALSLSAPSSQAAEDPDSLEFALRKIRELEASEALAARLAGAGDPAAPPVRRAVVSLSPPSARGGAFAAQAPPQTALNGGGGGGGGGGSGGGSVVRGTPRQPPAGARHPPGITIAGFHALIASVPGGRAALEGKSTDWLKTHVVVPSTGTPPHALPCDPSTCTLPHLGPPYVPHPKLDGHGGPACCGTSYADALRVTRPDCVGPSNAFL